MLKTLSAVGSAVFTIAAAGTLGVAVATSHEITQIACEIISGCTAGAAIGCLVVYWASESLEKFISEIVAGLNQPPNKENIGINK